LFGESFFALGQQPRGAEKDFTPLWGWDQAPGFEASWAASTAWSTSPAWTFGKCRRVHSGRQDSDFHRFCPLEDSTHSPLMKFLYTLGAVILTSMDVQTVKVNPGSVIIEGDCTVNGDVFPASDYAYRLGVVGSGWALVYSDIVAMNYLYAATEGFISLLRI
jgi:hypothetical protein